MKQIISNNTDVIAYSDNEYKKNIQLEIAYRENLCCTYTDKRNQDTEVFRINSLN